MLTTTPSLSGITSASSILDTSNYTIQAMTFGKDREGYKHHAHTDTWSGIDYSFSTGASGTSGASIKYQFSGAMVFVSANAIDSIMLVSAGTGGIAASSYFPSGARYNILPSPPTPLDKKLELDSKTIFSDISLTSNNVYSDPMRTDIADLVASSFARFENVGHNTNVLLDEVAAGFAPYTTLSGTSGKLLQAQGLLQGAFPRGIQHGGTSGAILTDVSQLDTGVGSTNKAVSAVSGNFVGNFNWVSSMDLSGYLGQVYNPYGVVGSGFTVADHADIQYSGIVVSANSDFSSTGEVVYQTVIGAGDLGFTNLYGGIYNIGLWALDIKESLKSGVPPYTWNPVSNTRKYKLFSKKSFTKSITHIQDKMPFGVNPGISNYADLTLIWRLYF